MEGNMIEAKRIAEVMGGRSVLGKVVGSIEELEEIVGEGLPKEALRITVRRVFAAPREANICLYRIVPEATYKRRTGKLRVVESERTERLARIIAAAEAVWDDQNDARKWLTTPHPELGDRAPIECALTELGARQVESLLDRLQYGLPV
jgi:putative toxin-antitoxin system antitoxin component (TIGR02293 family)